MARPGELRWAGAALRAESDRRGEGVRERTELSLFSGCSPFLSGCSFFVRKCVYRKQCLTRGWGVGRRGDKRIEELCRVHGR